MKLKIISTLTFLSLLFVPSTAGAVNVFNDVCSGNGSTSAACQDSKIGGGSADNPIFGKNGFITKIVNLLTVIVGIVAVIGIIIGSLKLITSGDNPQEVTKGRETILYALVAIVIAALAQVIVRFFISQLPG